MSNEEYLKAREEMTTHPRKRRYFQDYASDLMDELRLSIRGGKLKKDSKDNSPFKGWRSTVEHQVVVSLAVDVLAEALGLGDNLRENLRRNAAIHDWRKRIERTGQEPDQNQQRISDLSLDKIRPDNVLIEAMGPAFLNKLSANQAGLLEKILFYVDDITDLSEITPLRARIESARKRVSNHDWDREYLEASAVENELTDLLNQRGAKIEDHSMLPIFILQRIKERFDSVH